MADQREAGRKADAHRIRDRYRAAFDAAAKGVVRRRVVDTLVAAGGTVCLDLWGGGRSASALTEAGLRVISVDNGTMALEDRTYVVNAKRKRAALERTAAEGGYESRWGKAAAFASEADVAFLDFCGPWTPEVRRTVTACQHMKAVIVTLLSDHDLYVGPDLTPSERVGVYMTLVKMAFRPATDRSMGLSAAAKAVPGRLLSKYRRKGGQWAFVFLVAERPVPIRHLSWSDRLRLDPAAKKAAAVRQNARHRERRATDPAYKAHEYAKTRRWKLANRERALMMARHRKHQPGSVARANRKPCALCTTTPVLGAPAGEGHFAQPGT